MHHHDLCYHTYGFFEKGYRGQGYLYHLPALFQKAAVREGTRYIIGETLHTAMRPGLSRLYERLGARFTYARCYYAKDFY